MIHDSVASEASRLVRIVGRATLTMVVSSRAMNIPASSTIRACQERRGTTNEGAPPLGAPPGRGERGEGGGPPAGAPAGAGGADLVSHGGRPRGAQVAWVAGRASSPGPV